MLKEQQETLWVKGSKREGESYREQGPDQMGAVVQHNSLKFFSVRGIPIETFRQRTDLI